MTKFTEYINPYIGKLLQNIKMDKTFVRGEGCYLYDNEGKEYLDCIASYGALPFGYNSQEIWECIMDFYYSKEPSLIQPSSLCAAGELAEKLIGIVPPGLKYVTFTNSGAETVEAAIKLCRSALGRKGILSTQNSFHGKTLGALSATGNNSYQTPFAAPVKGFSFIPYGDLNALESELKDNSDFYAAFIVEPIQGEGGIVEPQWGYLKGVETICKKHGVFLIVDEIQTGLGRTGSMFACLQENISPDVLLLSKALGGGIMPIGACICNENVYSKDFGLKHSSTFAGNSLACRVGLKVLDLLTRDNSLIIENVKSTGKILKKGLSDLEESYPNTIKSIRGRGLMLGIEFGVNRDTFPKSLIGIMAEQELLTPVISSYLLNRENIRVAPTLNGNNVIRIEPPLVISEEQCYIALNGIENTLKVLQEGNTAKLLSYLVNDNCATATYQGKHKIEIEEKILPPKDDEEGRFAFLMHPVDLRNYCDFDESLSNFNNEELKILTDKWNDMVEPFVVSQMRIVSSCGTKAYGEFIAIPKTAEQLMNLPREQILKELKQAVQLAKIRGAKIVGLGAYTSVVSAGGLHLKDEGVALTTGNSYTVVSASDAIIAALEKLGSSPEKTCAAVIGAAGSIGRGVSTLLSEKVSKLILIGNSKNNKISCERLYNVAAEIYKYIAQLKYQSKILVPESIAGMISINDKLPYYDCPVDEFIKFAKTLKSSPVVISTSIDEMLPFANVVVSATSCTDKIITPFNLKHRAIVCDISRPSNVSEEVAKTRPDVIVIDGGIIEVPGLPSLGWNFGFEKGLAYACMSETMMLALDHHYSHTSLGASGISLESILYVKGLAKKHGFKLAKFKSFNKPLNDDIWNYRICDFPSSGTGAK